MKPFISPSKCKETRLALGLTQKELAELVGVCAFTISHYETGRVQVSPFTARRITGAFEELEKEAT